MKSIIVAIGLALAVTLGAAPAPAQSIMIGVSLPQDDNPFYIAMLRAIRTRAEELGWVVAIVSSNEDKARQINGCPGSGRAGRQGNPDLADRCRRRVNGAYDAAAAAHVPIISLARGSASPNQTLHIPMDEKQVGRDIAEWTAKQIGGQARSRCSAAPAGAPTFRNLEQGYGEVMAKYPGIQHRVQDRRPADSRARLEECRGRAGRQSGSRGDLYRERRRRARRRPGRDRGRPQGQDLGDRHERRAPALKAVKDGSLALTVELKPADWGRLGVDTLAIYLRGDKPAGAVTVPHTLVDQTNIDTKLPKT
ncbi:MAG: hypothetical protein WDO24_09845 [Pseudomonadota bacterium]